MPACRPIVCAPFGSGEGTTVEYDGASLPVHVLDAANAEELDVLFLAVDGEQSRAIMAGPGGHRSRWWSTTPAPSAWPMASRSSSPRPTPTRRASATGNLIANPNCTTAAAVVALAPIRDLAGLESVDLASYQAVSGAGRKGLDAFELERGTDHRDRADESPFHGRIADSVVPQIDVLDDDGWTGEERKIHAELRKILELPDLDVAATDGARSGPHRPLGRDPHPDGARRRLLGDDRGRAARPPRASSTARRTAATRHPMPLDVEGRDPVLVGRLRAIPGRERGFALWVSSDNLRKGAALNAVQSAAAADPERFGRLLPPPR